MAALTFGAFDHNPTESARGLSFNLPDIAALQKLNAEGDAGTFQRAHQLPSIVDLSVLFEEETAGPTRADTREFTLQFIAIEL